MKEKIAKLEQDLNKFTQDGPFILTFPGNGWTNQYTCRCCEATGLMKEPIHEDGCYFKEEEGR